MSLVLETEAADDGVVQFRPELPDFPVFRCGPDAVCQQDDCELFLWVDPDAGSSEPEMSIGFFGKIVAA